MLGGNRKNKEVTRVFCLAFVVCFYCCCVLFLRLPFCGRKKKHPNIRNNEGVMLGDSKKGLRDPHKKAHKKGRVSELFSCK